MSDEQEQILLPVEWPPVDMLIRKGWNGHIFTEDSELYTDGHAMVLRSQWIHKLPMADETMKWTENVTSVWEKSVASATLNACVVDIRRDHQGIDEDSDEPLYGYFVRLSLSDELRLTRFDADKYFMLKAVTGFDRIMAKDTEHAFVFFRGDIAVALLMPMRDY